MGPLMKKFNFRLKADLKRAKVSDLAVGKGNKMQQSMRIESDEASDSEAEAEEDEVQSPTAHHEDDGSDSISELSESASSTNEVPVAAARKKSFFGRRKRKPSSDAGTPIKKKGPRVQLFKRKGKASSLAPSSKPASKLGSFKDHHRVSFEESPRYEPQAMFGGAERPVQSDDRLMAFEKGTFNLIKELNDLGQGGIQDLREQLSSDNRECSEKIKRLLHQHYQAFISASKGIRAMDGEMQALRNFLNKQHSLLNSLKEIADPQGRFADRNKETASQGHATSRSWDDSPEGIRWYSSLQELDIVIAERRPAEALPLLKKTEKSLLPGQKSGLYSQALQSNPDNKTEKQAKVLAVRRQRLVEFVTSQIAGSRLGSKDMQVAVQVLASLSGRADALKRLLEAHSSLLRKSTNHLLKQQNSGADADGTDFSNHLGQLVFGAIAAASEDVHLIFGKELKDLASLFLVWALTETEKFALLLKRHALSPFAAPAGLGPTMNCCLLAYMHCAAVQASHGVKLTPRLMRDLWPACDQVMQRRIKRVVEDVKSAVVAEIETLVCQGLPIQSSTCAWSDLMQVLPSGDLLLDELEAIVHILVPMAGPRVREALSYAFTQVFREYTNAIALQYTHYRYADGTLPRVLDETIEMALEVCHSMVEQFLPELTLPLQAKCGELLNFKALNDQLINFQDKLLPPQDKDSIMDTSTSLADEEELDTTGREAYGSRRQESMRSIRSRRQESMQSRRDAPSQSRRQDSLQSRKEEALRARRQDSIRSKGLELARGSGDSGSSMGTQHLEGSAPASRTASRNLDATLLALSAKLVEDNRIAALTQGSKGILTGEGMLAKDLRQSLESAREGVTHHERHLWSENLPEGHASPSNRARMSMDVQENGYARPRESSDTWMSSDESTGDRLSSEQAPWKAVLAPIPSCALGEVEPDLSAEASESSDDEGSEEHHSHITENGTHRAPQGSGPLEDVDVTTENSEEEEDTSPQLQRLPGRRPSDSTPPPAPWPMNPTALKTTMVLEEDDDDDVQSLGESEGEAEEASRSSKEEHGIAKVEERKGLAESSEGAESIEDTGDEAESEVDDDYILSQLTNGVATNGHRHSDTQASSDLEEMNEELSDYDEDDMIAQLRKMR